MQAAKLIKTEKSFPSQAFTFWSAFLSGLYARSSLCIPN